MIFTASYERFQSRQKKKVKKNWNISKCSNYSHSAQHQVTENQTAKQINSRKPNQRYYLSISRFTCPEIAVLFTGFFQAALFFFC